MNIKKVMHLNRGAENKGRERSSRPLFSASFRELRKS